MPKGQPKPAQQALRARQAKTESASEQQITAAQVRRCEIEAELTKELSGLRLLLAKTLAELRERRDGLELTDLDCYTEREAAAVLKVSEVTLRRLRTQYDDQWPHWRAGDLVRYTGGDLLAITEWLRTGRRDAKRRGSCAT